MRHYKRGRKLGTDKSHTKAMKKSLVCALFTNDRIKTIDVRAKEIRSDVDKIITWAKKGDLHSRRLAIAAMGDKELVREVFEKVAQGMFADRNGGYTRIVKLGNRKGDNAPMVIMELVTEPVKKKTAAKPAASGAKAAASGAKKAAAGGKSAGAGGKKAASKKAAEEAAEAKAEAAEEAAEGAGEAPVEATAEATEAPAEEAAAEAETEATPEAEAAADDTAASEAAAGDEQKDEAAE